MRPLLTAALMREADRRTIEEIGLPGAVLMESAGAAVARAVRERWPGARRVHVLCGRGNNGGDGYVTARRLLSDGLEVCCALLGDPASVSGHAALHKSALEKAGGAVEVIADETAWAAGRDSLLACDVLVDALLGTGLTEAPRGLLGAAIADLEQLQGGPAVVAVDLPSGLSSDSGVVPGAAVRADLTVTFGAAKLGHVLAPACDHVGELLVADIGIPSSLLASTCAIFEAPDAAVAFPRRGRDAHKGHFGHVLVLAGSEGKSGAAVLAGLGALVAGAGLVTVAVPAEVQAIVAGARPELMVEALPFDADGVERALSLARVADAVVLGPGLGQGAPPAQFCRGLLRRYSGPMVIDADGLHFARGTPALLRRPAPTVLTPHPGEMARLLGTVSDSVQADRLGSARACAAESEAVVVLKGAGTLVARPDGQTTFNPTGNPGMATAGSGDVLAGLVGALLARGTELSLAARAAVWAHGRAGDLAAERMGEDAVTAGDLLDALPAALRELATA